MKQFILLLVMVIICLGVACKGSIKDINPDALMSLLGSGGAGFGIGLIGLLSLGKKFRKAVKEITEAVILIRRKITDKEILHETDEACESIADICEQLKMKDIAKKLRDFIR